MIASASTAETCRRVDIRSSLLTPFKSLGSPLAALSVSSVNDHECIHGAETKTASRLRSEGVAHAGRLLPPLDRDRDRGWKHRRFGGGPAEVRLTTNIPNQLGRGHAGRLPWTLDRNRLGAPKAASHHGPPAVRLVVPCQFGTGCVAKHVRHLTSTAKKSAPSVQ